MVAASSNAKLNSAMMSFRCWTALPSRIWNCPTGRPPRRASCTRRRALENAQPIRGREAPPLHRQPAPPGPGHGPSNVVAGSGPPSRPPGVPPAPTPQPLRSPPRRGMRVISPTSPAPTLILNRDALSAQIIGTGGTICFADRYSPVARTQYRWCHWTVPTRSSGECLLGLPRWPHRSNVMESGKPGTVSLGAVQYLIAVVLRLPATSVSDGVGFEPVKFTASEVLVVEVWKLCRQGFQSVRPDTVGCSSMRS